jgi:restriction endonuclease S subunit
MKETNITDIILFEGGTFTHTGIKTCALIFEKDKTGTKNINFIQANKECTTLTKITSVSIEDIEKEPNFSWYLRDYLKDEYIEELSSKMSDFEWIEFGDIFTLEKGKIQSSKVEEDENGLYPVISKCQNYEEWKYTNQFKIDGENIYIFLTSNTTKLGITYYNGKCMCTDLVSRLIIKEKYNNKINIKYIYYYLKSNKEHIENTYLRGSCHQSLDQKNFNRMKIPIPTLEEQGKIIQNIMELEESKKDILKGIDANKKMRQKYMEAMIKGATNKGINKKFKLGQVVEHLPNGKRKSSEGTDCGIYPLYYCSINNILYMDEYDFEDEAITMNITNGSGKCNLFHTKGKYSVAETTLHFKSKDEKIIKTNILYNYLLLVKNSICKIYKGTQQMSINKDDFNNKIIVLVPPLDYQNKMEQTLNNFDGLDEGFNKMLIEIENNSKTAFLNSLDDYGNSNGFNLDKIIELQTEDEEIKQVKKPKTKSKSINV